jgi:DNA-directed RNA polymerase subunit RPC12/RpoP
MFCYRCGAEIKQAPESETDEVTVWVSQPETGDNDGRQIATVCLKCSKEIEQDCTKWKRLQIVVKKKRKFLEN